MRVDFRRLDIYRKVPKDLTQPTYIGAIVSVCSVLFIIFLMMSELASFIQTELVSELFVDSPDGAERIPVRLNITLPKMSCDYVGLDIQDEMGRHEVGFHENIKKDDIHGGGCRFQSLFYINRVPGNFHVSTHGAGHQPSHFDMSHIINGLQFGDVITEESVKGAFKAISEHSELDANGLSSHDYVLRIVPTIYEKRDGSLQNSFQYTWAHKEYTSYGHGGMGIVPAIWFRYDLNAITVKYVERRKPFYHFITTVCAIVGGTFTVAGIIDSMIFTANEIFRKAEMGKLS